MRRTTSRPKTKSAKAKGSLGEIPGPSSNPATNLLIIDVALKGASMLVWRGMQKALLSTRYTRGQADNIVQGRSIVESATAMGAARMATRSVPGFLLVATGLFAKVVLDRSMRPQEAKRRGEKQLAETAARAEDE